MSDSDSEDSLLAMKGLSPKKRKRKDEKRIQKGFDLMDEALDHADRIADNHNRILQIKQEHYGSEDQGGDDDDDQRLQASLARTEQTKAAAKANQTAAEEQRDFIEGSFPDDENVLTRERRKQLGRCMFSEVNCGLGLRRTIIASNSGGMKSKNDSPYFFTDGSLQTHKKDLTTLLGRIVSPNNKPLQVAWIQPLRNAKKTTAGLALFLRTHQLAKLREKHDLAIIPEEVLVWILGVACSSSSSSNDDKDTVRDAKNTSLVPALRSAALTALLGLMKQHQQIAIRMRQEYDNAESLIQKLSFLKLSQMELQLLNWAQFGSCTSEKVEDNKSKTRHDNDKQDTSMMEETGDTEESIQTAAKDHAEVECRARGLKRWLDVWSKAFRYDLVTCDADWKGAATQCLALLAKVGVDGCTFSSQKDCRLLVPLQKVISSLLECVEKQFQNERNDLGDQQSTLHDWMKDTAAAIVEELKASDLGPGAAETEDADDPEAWLCFSLVGRVFPTNSKDTKVSTTAVAQFKAFLSMEMLRHVCGVSKAWQVQVSEVVYEKCKQSTEEDHYPTDFLERSESSLRWRALSSAWVALLELEKRFGNKLAENGPRCYAILSLALESCMSAGLALFRGFQLPPAKDTSGSTDTTGSTIPVTPPQDDPGAKDKRPNEFKTKEEAINVARLLELLRDRCQAIERSVFSFQRGKAHFRRMTSLLQWHCKYCGEFRGKSARQAGKGDFVQNSLDAWIKKEHAYDEGSDDDEKEESDSENNAPEEGVGSSPKRTKTVAGVKREDTP